MVKTCYACMPLISLYCLCYITCAAIHMQCLISPNSLLNTNIWPLFLYYGDIEKTFYFQTGSTRIARSQLLDLNSISPCQPIFTCILVGNSVIVSTSPDNRHSLIKDANSFNTWHLFIGTFRGINRQATFLVFTLLCIYLNVHLVAPCSVSVYSLLQHVYVYTLMQPSYQIKCNY